jgi:hypothetical protein
MKTETFEKIYIRSESDLPKENGSYHVHFIWQTENTFSYFPFDRRNNTWISTVEYYLSPVQSEESQIRRSKEEIINILKKHLPEMTDVNHVRYIELRKSVFESIASELAQGEIDAWCKTDESNLIIK